MSIERRYHQRIKTDIKVQLNYRGRNFSANTSNITSHGLGLKTGFLTIPSGNLVELELRVGNRKWQVEGLVIHADKHNIGLMFRAPQPELEAAVRTRLQGLAHRPSAPALRPGEPPLTL
ncbi:MAG: PilZ domain-containing protein [Candidatus Sedimenticola sp. 6PFRAG7]